MGFHSNSALGIMLQVDPFTGEPADASPAFARARGGEFGVRSVALRGLQTTATAWYLDFDSELIYVGDSGSTEAGPASRRMGLEITNYIYPNRWITMDLDVSFSRARFLDVPADEAFVPGALNRVISGGLAVNPPAAISAGPFGSLRLRHFGPRPLLEDNSRTSKSTSIVNGEAGYTVLQSDSADAGRLQSLQRRSLGHRLFLRVPTAGRARAGGRPPLPRRDSTFRAARVARVVLRQA